MTVLGFGRIHFYFSYDFFISHTIFLFLRAPWTGPGGPSVRPFVRSGLGPGSEISDSFTFRGAWGPKIATVSRFESPRPENCDSSMFWPDPFLFLIRFFLFLIRLLCFSGHPGPAPGAVRSSVRPFGLGPGLKLATV